MKPSRHRRIAGAADPLAALILCGAHGAARVMVGGRWLVDDGAIPGLDIETIVRRHNDAAKWLRGRRSRSGRWQAALADEAATQEQLARQPFNISERRMHLAVEVLEADIQSDEAIAAV